MILWINGAFGSGKTTAAYELQRLLPDSFIYDPENVGYFIRKNSNRLFSEGDFQDLPLWREMNYKLLKMVSESYSGIVIVPMTLVNPQYFDEIIGALRGYGVEVRHVILYASRETIMGRLRKRNLGRASRDQFAIDAIARCLHSFDTQITEGKIMTDDLNIDGVIEAIAKEAKITLASDKRGRLRKCIDRLFTALKHIRV